MNVHFFNYHVRGFILKVNTLIRAELFLIVTARPNSHYTQTQPQTAKELICQIAVAMVAAESP